MKILISGSKGYVGSNLFENLIDFGYDVNGIDLGIFKIENKFNIYNSIKKIEEKTKTGDFRDMSINDLKEYDTIIHLANISNDPGLELDNDIIYRLNFLDTAEFGRRAKQAGVKRFIFASSAAVYGASGDSLKTEESKVNPLTAYASCKFLSEQALSFLADDKFTVCSPRFGTVFGASPRFRLETFINNYTFRAVFTDDHRLFGDPYSNRPFIYMRSLIDGIKLILEAESEDINKQVFNLSQYNCVVKDTAELICNETDCKPELSPNPSKDLRSYLMDTSKIKNVLGFSPRDNLKADLKELVDNLKNSSYKKEDLNDINYNTIKRWVQVLTERSV